MRSRRRLKAGLVALTLLAPAFQILLASPAHAGIVTNGLLLRLNSKAANSYSSGTTWYDTSGNSRNATLYNGATTSALTQVNSQKAPAMAFDNSNVASGTTNTTPSTGKFAAIASSLSLGAFSKFSISFTANFGTPSGNGWDRIIDFGNGSTSDNILVARNGTSNSLTMELFNGATSYGYCSDTSAITNGVWAHYAMVVNGTNCKVYINGVLHYTNASYTGLPSNVSRSYNFIGRSNWSSDTMFAGEISDIALYNTELLQTDIDQNYPEQTTAQFLSVSSSAPVSATMGGATYAIVDTATSGLSPSRAIDATSLSVCSISGTVISFIGNGSCKINISQAGNSNYSPATTISQTFSVTGASTLTFTVPSTATYRQVSGLTASVNTAGKVTFYSQGRVIIGCKNLAVTNSVTCNWRPSIHTTVALKATFTPSNGTLSNVTNQGNTLVVKRTNNR